MIRNASGERIDYYSGSDDYSSESDDYGSVAKEETTSDVAVADVPVRCIYVSEVEDDTSSDETGDDSGGEETEAEVTKALAAQEAANAQLDAATTPAPASEAKQRGEREWELGMGFRGREFGFQLPGGVTERFSTCQAALLAYKCFFLRGGHRPDLASKFSTTGKFAHVNGARVLHRKFIRLLRKEGLSVDAAAWTQFQTDATTSVVCARAYDDVRFARHCRAAVRQGLSTALPHAHAIKTAGRILLGME
jgi:hypothetical protein